MKKFLLGAGLFHAAIMIGELFRWREPFILAQVLSKHPDIKFDCRQLCLLATVVHNAAIYNGIVAGGLLWAASGKASLDVARVMLWGAVAAGIFGAVTLGWPTAIQAVVGIVGLMLLRGK